MRKGWRRNGVRGDLLRARVLLRTHVLLGTHVLAGTHVEFKVV